MSRYSKNPNTGEIFDLPENHLDHTGIDNFLSKNKDKKVIVIQGLGFVGAVMSIVCANSEKEDYAVIGVDLLNEYTYWKIKSINDGIFPIISSDKNVDLYFKKAVKKGNFYATYDTYAYKKADVIIIDINLDVSKKNNFRGDLLNYNVNLSNFKKAINSVAENCKEDVLVLTETTVPPGTTKMIIQPIIEKGLKKRNLNHKKIKLGHSYERVMPGPDYIDSIKNFYRVYSGVDEESEIATRQFLETIISTKKYPLTKLGNTNATEMAKVLENSFRAMNIAFIVEWSRFAEDAGVNLYEVVEAIRQRPTHKNMMFPGIGVGGYCLTKDPLLASWSKTNLFNSDDSLSQSVRGVEINDLMPFYSFQFIKYHHVKDLANKNILILGVSYRSDVADTRYTPVENLYNHLEKTGANLFLHDPYVTFWEEKNIDVSPKLDLVSEKLIDLIIISTAHLEYSNINNILDKINVSKNLMIFDLVGVLQENQIKILKNKFNLKILGRGDI